MKTYTTIYRHHDGKLLVHESKIHDSYHSELVNKFGGKTIILDKVSGSYEVLDIKPCKCSKCN